MGVVLDVRYEGVARQGWCERYTKGTRSAIWGGIVVGWCNVWCSGFDQGRTSQADFLVSPLACIFPSIHIKRVPTTRHGAWTGWSYRTGARPSRVLSREGRRGKGVVPIPPIGLKVLRTIRGRFRAGTPTIPARGTILPVRCRRASALTFSFTRDTAHRARAKRAFGGRRNNHKLFARRWSRC